MWHFLAPFIFPFLDSRTYLGTTQFRRGLLACTGEEEVKDRDRRYKPLEARSDAHLQVHREYSRREITRDKSRRPRPRFTALSMNVSRKIFSLAKKSPRNTRDNRSKSETKIQAMTPQTLFGHRHFSSLKSFSIFMMYQLKYSCQYKKKSGKISEKIQHPLQIIIMILIGLIVNYKICRLF